MSRKWKRILLAVMLLAVLTGCSMDPAVNPIDPDNGFWDRYFVFPLSFSLDWLADLMWEEYGLSILVVTIVIRCLILPLTLKQYRNSKQMQLIQPELKKIKEKYKDDTQKQQEETMKLFQKNNVNPLAGCFPMLVQMPILIGLYHAIMRNADIGSHSFLWMQLGERDPFILPILAALTTFIQQRMMANQMPKQMQALLFIFPALIFVMALSFPSALPLYWIYSNIFTIVQTYFIYGRSQGTQAKGGLSK